MIEGTEVLSSTGVVAANPAPAARIGARVLAAGGNAMDAAVAAGIACCMLRPEQTGIGGYVCAAVVRDGRDGQVWSVDADGTAPAAACEAMFRTSAPGEPRNPGALNEREYACAVADDANIFGPLAVTVPGVMAGFGSIHERWGRLPWAQVVAPAQALLADGFPYGPVAHAVRHMEPVLRRFPATAAHLLPGGKLPDPETVWRRPDMETTLARLAASGWRDFYAGELGRRIADHIQDLGGILTRADMANYQPRITPPCSTTYRGASVHAAILPNGGFSVLQALNMLECLDLPAEDSPDYWHLLAEVLKLAWRDRLAYLGDPDFADVPAARLLSKDYAAGRVETLRRFPEYVDRLQPEPTPEPAGGTLHLSAADAEGNLVSMTFSHGGAFGSCVTVPGAGILLGHGMCRLDPRPGCPNSVAPGKRPLNNTAALLVKTPDRNVAIGLPGGRKIICVMTRAAQLLIDRGCTARQAAAAPRLHVEITEPLEIDEVVAEPVLARLSALDHDVTRVPRNAGIMNGAEYLQDARTRAGSGESAAGAE